MADQLAQRVVYAGLRRMTDDRSVIKSAYARWFKELSNQEFDALTIVTDLVDFLGLSSQEKKTLMIALHAASNKLVDELSPVPGIISGDGDVDLSAANGRDTETDKKADVTSPHQQVTQRYMQLFCQYIRRVDAGDFTDFRKALAKEKLSGIDKSLANVISNWASDGLANLKLPNDIEVSACQALTHELYMFASEFIGPNHCDDIVVNTVNECLKMEAATRFNPRDLV